MPVSKRLWLMRVHAALAAFFLPVGLLFLATGALYTLGFEGGTSKRTFRIDAPGAHTLDLAALTELARRELAPRGIAPPTGEPRLRSRGGRDYLDWRDLGRRVKLTPSPAGAELEVRESDWLRILMRIHTADAGPAFRVLAVAWAGALLALFASGVALGFSLPALRPWLLGSMAVGLGGFLGALLLG